MSIPVGEGSALEQPRHLEKRDRTWVEFAVFCTSPGRPWHNFSKGTVGPWKREQTAQIAARHLDEPWSGDEVACGPHVVLGRHMATLCDAWLPITAPDPLASKPSGGPQ